jgi:hypothetical protein
MPESILQPGALQSLMKLSYKSKHHPGNALGVRRKASMTSEDFAISFSSEQVYFNRPVMPFPTYNAQFECVSIMQF